jgi:hypothetical protein
MDADWRHTAGAPAPQPAPAGHSERRDADQSKCDERRTSDDASSNCRAKYYRSTKVGRRQIEAEKASWDRLKSVITFVPQNA